MHYLLKWKMFTDSRWVTIGTASRLLLLSISVGLEALVSTTRNLPNVSDFHLHGFEKMTQPAAAFAVYAALGAYPVEALSLELLEDDRLGRRLEELKEVVASEVEYLGSVTDATWARLALLAGNAACSGPELKHEVLSVVHTSVSFVHRQVFQEFAKYPYALCAGQCL